MASPTAVTFTRRPAIGGRCGILGPRRDQIFDPITLKKFVLATPVEL